MPSHYKSFWLPQRSLTHTKILISFFLIAASATVHAAQFFRLPKRANDESSIVNDVASGGQTAVGAVIDAAGISHAAAWQRVVTGYNLTVLDNSTEYSIATAVSEDGSVIVGRMMTAMGQTAARWKNGVLNLIGDVDGGAFMSEAVAISDNGKVIACNGTSGSGHEVFMWSESGGIEVLEDIAGGDRYSYATCISGDGLIVGGYSKSAANDLQAVVWNGSGIVPMLGGSRSASVLALSFDGTVIAGYARTLNSVGSTFSDAEAILWNASGGFQEMGDLPGWIFSSDIQSCSFDGSIMVGHASIAEGYVPAIWVNRVGPVTLSDYFLRKFGLDLSSVDLEMSVCVSSCGLQFAGRINYDDLSSDGWLVDLAVPEIVVEQPPHSKLVDSKSDKAFGNVEVGVRGKAKKFTIKNTGTAKLTGLSISKKGKNASNFVVSRITVPSLAPGMKATFTVIFKPSSEGRRRASVHIKSNDANENPFDIKLSGNGVSRKN